MSGFTGVIGRTALAAALGISVITGTAHAAEASAKPDKKASSHHKPSKKAAKPSKKAAKKAMHKKVAKKKAVKKQLKKIGKVKGVKKGKGKVAAPRPGAAAPGQVGTVHQHWGQRLNAKNKGVKATQSIDSKLRAGRDGDYIYGPTIKNRHGSCIELTTAYTSSSAQVWAYNWCTKSSQRVGASKNIDDSFKRAYGSSNYTAKISRTNKKKNTWTAYLYNREAKRWDRFYTSSGRDNSGSQGGKDGWNIMETYTERDGGRTYTSKALGGSAVSSSRVKVQTPKGKWVPAGKAAMTSGDSDMRLKSTKDGWTVRVR